MVKARRMMTRAFLMGASRWSLAVTRHATTVA